MKNVSTSTNKTASTKVNAIVAHAITSANKTPPKATKITKAKANANAVDLAIVEFRTLVQTGANNRELVFEALDKIKPSLGVPTVITLEYKPDYMTILGSLLGVTKQHLSGCSGLRYPEGREYSKDQFKVYRYAYNLIREWFKVRGLVMTKTREPRPKDAGTAEGVETPSPQSTTLSPIDAVHDAVEMLKDYEDNELLSPKIRDAIAMLTVAFAEETNKASKAKK